MTRFLLTLLSGAALALAACGGNDAKTSQVDTEQIQAKAEASLANMDIGETIDYLNLQSLEVTDLLKTVTDEASAKAAVEELRQRGPKLKAALESFQTVDENEISFGVLRKLPKLMQTQAGLLAEVSRINETPEARDVIQAELDKLNLGDLRIDTQ